jgi:TfoX/Sxy family transcriptional regulator of competence genes
MSTQQRTIDYLIEQASGASTVSAKLMFGEYGVFIEGKMVGSICDDQLFVKSTAMGRAHAEPVARKSRISAHTGTRSRSS